MPVPVDAVPVPVDLLEELVAVELDFEPVVPVAVEPVPPAPPVPALSPQPTSDALTMPTTENAAKMCFAFIGNPPEKVVSLFITDPPTVRAHAGQPTGPLSSWEED